MLMRNGDAPKPAITRLAELRDQASTANLTFDTLRGIEGMAAAIYFEHFGTMLKGTAFETFVSLGPEGGKQIFRIDTIGQPYTERSRVTIV
jgi:hypothetical protein